MAAGTNWTERRSVRNRKFTDNKAFIGMVTVAYPGTLAVLSAQSAQQRNGNQAQNDRRHAVMTPEGKLCI